MSTTTYVYVGYYLKCKQAKYKIPTTISVCASGHERFSGRAKFCERCGEPFLNKDSCDMESYIFENLTDDVLDEEIDDRTRELVADAFTRMAGCDFMDDGHEFLAIDNYCTEIDADEESGEIDLKGTIRDSPGYSIRHSDDVIAYMKDNGFHEILGIIYELIELKFGVVITAA